jgi:hypothetical protein
LFGRVGLALLKTAEDTLLALPFERLLTALNSKQFPAFSRPPAQLLKLALSFRVSRRLAVYLSEYQRQQQREQQQKEQQQRDAQERELQRTAQHQQQRRDEEQPNQQQQPPLQPDEQRPGTDAPSG